MKSRFQKFPICIAKTQYSFSSDPTLTGAPDNHTLEVREVRLMAGAEFIVVICGDIMTMPGLPKIPSAEKINISSKGLVTGLFNMTKITSAWYDINVPCRTSCPADTDIPAYLEFISKEDFTSAYKINLMANIFPGF